MVRTFLVETHSDQERVEGHDIHTTTHEKRESNNYFRNRKLLLRPECDNRREQFLEADILGKVAMEQKATFSRFPELPHSNMEVFQAQLTSTNQYPCTWKVLLKEY